MMALFFFHSHFHFSNSSSKLHQYPLIIYYDDQKVTQEWNLPLKRISLDVHILLCCLLQSPVKGKWSCWNWMWLTSRWSKCFQDGAICACYILSAVVFVFFKGQKWLSIAKCWIWPSFVDDEYNGWLGKFFSKIFHKKIERNLWVLGAGVSAVNKQWDAEATQGIMGPLISS